jgi:hypothetical protein
MNRKISRLMSVAFGTAAFAMMTGPLTASQQSPAPNPSNTQANRDTAGQPITVSGCIQREADYRRTAGAGRGGAASTGVGTGNEFVLTNAMMSTASSGSPAASSGAAAPSATGTAGTTGNTAYELTGTHEGDAAAFVGKRVEITGTMKAMTGAAGGPTATVPGSTDLKLSELDVTSIRETTGTCSASPTAP